jgi:hypothetical protein
LIFLPHKAKNTLKSRASLATRAIFAWPFSVFLDLIGNIVSPEGNFLHVFTSSLVYPKQKKIKKLLLWLPELFLSVNFYLKSYFKA